MFSDYSAGEWTAGGVGVLIIAFVLYTVYKRFFQKTYKSLKKYDFLASVLLGTNEGAVTSSMCEQACDQNAQCAGYAFCQNKGCRLYSNTETVLLSDDSSDIAYYNTKHSAPVNITNAYLSEPTFTLCGKSVKKRSTDINTEQKCKKVCETIDPDNPCTALSYDPETNTCDIYSVVDTKCPIDTSLNTSLLYFVNTIQNEIPFQDKTYNALPEDNFQLLSTSYISQTVSKKSQCSSSCDSTFECQGYSFDSKNDTCTLLSDVTYKVPYDTSTHKFASFYSTNTYTEPVLFPKSYTIKNNVSYIINSASSTLIVLGSASACQGLCDSTYGCRAFNYIEPTSCMIVYNVSALQATNPSFITTVGSTVPFPSVYTPQSYSTKYNTSYQLVAPSLTTITIQTTSTDDCIAACDRNYYCEGVNLNMDTSTCTLFTNPSGVNANFYFQPSTSKNHYAYLNTVPPPDVLPVAYNRTTNTSYQLYQPSPLLTTSVSTTVDCERLCNLTYLCKGYNFKDGSCALVSDDSVLRPVEYFSAPSYSTYAYKQTDASPVVYPNIYTYSPNVSFMITQQNGSGVQVQNSAQCQNMCDLTYKCQGFNYNTSTSMCNLVTSIDPLTVTPLPLPIMTYAYLHTTPTVRPQTYTRVPNASYALVTNTSPTVKNSALNCEYQCDATYGCVAYNYNSTTQKCALFTGSNTSLSIVPFNACTQTYAYLSSFESPSIQPQTYQFKPSVSFDLLNPLVKLNLSSGSLCQAACDFTYGCNSFTYNPVSSSCTLSASNTMYPVLYPVLMGTTSAPVLRTQQYSSVKNSSYQIYGTPLSTTQAMNQVATETDCQNMCNITYGCNGYNFLNTCCTLFSNVSYIYPTSTTQTYGYANTLSTPIVHGQMYTSVSNTSFLLNTDGAFFNTSSLLLCQQACDKTYNCVGFNYTNTSLCSLVQNTSFLKYSPFSTDNSQTYGFLVSVPAPTLTQKQYTVNTVPNALKYSNDIPYNVYSASTCQSLCDSTYQCVAYAYDPATTTCTLSSSNVTTPTPYPIQTGCSVCPLHVYSNMYTSVSNTSYMLQGNPLFTTNTINETQCRSVCDGTYRCVGYNYLNGSCSLMSTTSTIVPTTTLGTYGINSLLPSPTVYSQPFSVTTNTSYMFNIFTPSINVPTSASCASLCNTTANCVAYNYNSPSCTPITDSSKLFLTPVSTTPSTSYTYATTVAPLGMVSGTYNVVNNTSYQFVTSSTPVPASTFDTCLSQCNSAYQCTGVNYSDGMCTPISGDLKLQPVSSNNNSYAFLSSSVPSLYQKPYTTTSSTYYNINTVSSSRVTPTAPKCQQLCDQTYGCIGFLYNADNAICSLTASNTITPQSTNNNTYSFMTSVSPEVARKPYVYVTNSTGQLKVGNNAPSSIVPNLQTCMNLCDSTYNCQGFNYNNGMCTLGIGIASTKTNTVPITQSSSTNNMNYAYINPPYTPLVS